MGSHQTRRADIETAIDQCDNFAEFLEFVAEICNEKAEHIQASPLCYIAGLGLTSNDHLLAKIWEKRARLVEEVSDLVEHEILTGTTALEIAGERIRGKYFVPIKPRKTKATTTFIEVPKKPGSSQHTINVERDGKPFGQIWTWPNTATEHHLWHVKPLNGNHETFDNLKDAKTHMEGI